MTRHPLSPRSATKANTSTASTAPPGHAGPLSLMRVLRILDVVSRSKEGMSLADLSATLEAPKSSLLSLLRALTHEGYLNYVHGAYTTGTQSYRLAASIMVGRKLQQLARPFLEELAARTGETVILTVLDQETQAAIYADVIDSPQALRYSVQSGASRPLYATSGGRVLLAWQDDAWRKAYLAKVKLEHRTKQSIEDRKALAAELVRIREDGYSVTDGQWAIGGVGVGAPVFGINGTECVAALSIACLAPRFASNKKKIIADLLEMAQGASGLY
ncbi:IclR family transcriptional regulator [Hydrogenophaga sp.]|uniref:IclR family transcriptional regulator n=1 Tax=Hydrogenophaga sp. TaxID=1904254 RepID=UPI00271B9F27|nr:IclR family transcriptional regulator [Hydrogenophaga sp.]MDO9437605.1 IclR family transcriptional regulator [Hydrogenophaga sp.]